MTFPLHSATVRVDGTEINDVKDADAFQGVQQTSPSKPDRASHWTPALAPTLADPTVVEALFGTNAINIMCGVMTDTIISYKAYTLNGSSDVHVVVQCTRESSTSKTIYISVPYDIPTPAPTDLNVKVYLFTPDPHTSRGTVTTVVSSTGGVEDQV